MEKKIKLMEDGCYSRKIVINGVLGYEDKLMKIRVESDGWMEEAGLEEAKNEGFSFIGKRDSVVKISLWKGSDGIGECECKVAESTIGEMTMKCSDKISVKVILQKNPQPVYLSMFELKGVSMDTAVEFEFFSTPSEIQKYQQLSEHAKKNYFPSFKSTKLADPVLLKRTTESDNILVTIWKPEDGKDPILVAELVITPNQFQESKNEYFFQNEKGSIQIKIDTVKECLGSDIQKEKENEPETQNQQISSEQQTNIVEQKNTSKTEEAKEKEVEKDSTSIKGEDTINMKENSKNDPTGSETIQKDNPVKETPPVPVKEGTSIETPPIPVKEGASTETSVPVKEDTPANSQESSKNPTKETVSEKLSPQIVDETSKQTGNLPIDEPLDNENEEIHSVETDSIGSMTPRRLLFALEKEHITLIEKGKREEERIRKATESMKKIERQLEENQKLQLEVRERIEMEEKERERQLLETQNLESEDIISKPYICLVQKGNEYAKLQVSVDSIEDLRENIFLCQNIDPEDEHKYQLRYLEEEFNCWAKIHTLNGLPRKMRVRITSKKKKRTKSPTKRATTSHSTHPSKLPSFSRTQIIREYLGKQKRLMNSGISTRGHTLSPKKRLKPSPYHSQLKKSRKQLKTQGRKRSQQKKTPMSKGKNQDFEYIPKDRHETWDQKNEEPKKSSNSQPLESSKYDNVVQSSISEIESEHEAKQVSISEIVNTTQPTNASHPQSNAGSNLGKSNPGSHLGKSNPGSHLGKSNPGSNLGDVDDLMNGIDMTDINDADLGDLDMNDFNIDDIEGMEM